MYLKPSRSDVRVPDPAMQGTPLYFLPAEGREVDDSPFWRRRLLDGDVVECAPPAAAAESQAQA